MAWTETKNLSWRNGILNPHSIASVKKIKVAVTDNARNSKAEIRKARD
jgi:hypothetical protein